ncbi:peptidase M3A and M3B thimet/oligopeptidase F [Anaerosalibacter bizertensis]|uniref:Peptidase M3A and M3B thimet/oligopeptidase F n=1 Tax=Anaerosalibacter bizertensis TaxID=932217 RepID=A0A844FEK1_9FIRM|nr:M3 family metallopeptidase [Anaerosalibacter bizertensis]MBU5293677.1 hypothetical protein [Anaerosalibacter bizertensis]MSS42424.1 peptidase M3A and M3B thimet/oligopeptidase F [Anaerosalibacter bizertensis]
MDKLESLAKGLEEIQVDLMRRSWVQYTVGYDFGIDEVYEKLNSFMSDKKNFYIVCKYLDMDLNEIDKRKVEILYNAFKPYHLSKELNELNLEIQKKTNELSQVLNTFRFNIEGKEITSVEITQILSNEEDRNLRKKAYFARNQINKPLVDAGFIELINLRKEYAKAYGDNDFVEHKLKIDELSPGIFNSWKDELSKYIDILNNKRMEYAEKFIHENELMPWDQDYIGSKIAPSLNTTVDMSNYYNILMRFFLNFGIDIDKYNITYDIFSRKNKSEWGYNFPIETGKDSRILANVKNKYHEYEVLLHETGHGIHSFLLKPEERILNAGVSGIISEGIANLFGGFIYEEIFYKNFFGSEVKDEFVEMKEFDKLNYLRFVGDIFFDQELYRNNIENLDDIYEVYFKVFRELFNDKIYNEEPPFGYRIHHTTHPIYMHNYFMGDVTCEMLKKVFNKKHGTSSITEKPREFGEFLINEVINPSGLYKYEELFEKISGEKFSLNWYLE